MPVFAPALSSLNLAGSTSSGQRIPGVKACPAILQRMHCGFVRMIKPEHATDLPHYEFQADA